MFPSVLVVVLHYSGLDDTRECLSSLWRQSYPNMRTLVIENGGPEKLGDNFEQSYPFATVMRLPENHGWSGGNNVGIRIAMERGYDYVCLLNNDTVVPDGTIARLIGTASALEPGVLHPVIESYDPADGVQLDPTIPRPPHLKVHAVPGKPDVYDIAFLNGSCVLFHVSIFRRIGLIDERFFLLCEDTDIGWRAQEAGYRMYCDTGARIRHKESRAFGGLRTPIKTYYSTRNVLLLREKHRDHHGSLLRQPKEFFWDLWGMAEASGATLRSPWDFGRWFFSALPFARAARMGTRDYLLRRFGRLDKREETMLRGATLSTPSAASTTTALQTR